MTGAVAVSGAVRPDTPAEPFVFTPENEAWAKERVQAWMTERPSGVRSIWLFSKKSNTAWSDYRRWRLLFDLLRRAKEQHRAGYVPNGALAEIVRLTEIKAEEIAAALSKAHKSGSFYMFVRGTGIQSFKPVWKIILITVLGIGVFTAVNLFLKNDVLQSVIAFLMIVFGWFVLFAGRTLIFLPDNPFGVR